MKNMLIAMVAVLLMLSSVSLAQRAQILSGTVKYPDGDSVGPNKPVYIWTTPSTYEVDYTNAHGTYGYSFYPPKYFYKVSCGFVEEHTYWEGETIIDSILTTDATYDITVVVVGEPP